MSEILFCGFDLTNHSDMLYRMKSDEGHLPSYRTSSSSHRPTTNKKRKNKMEWKTPPKAVRYKRSNRDWAEIADSLKNNPNEWALIAKDVNPSTVTHIRYGRLKAFGPEGQFEASGHGRNGEGYTKELYARYVGAGVARTTASTARASIDTVVTETPAGSPAVDFFTDPEL
jgi:hypothetical protein